MKKVFSIADSFQFGFREVFHHFWFLLKLNVVFYAALLGSMVVAGLAVSVPFLSQGLHNLGNVDPKVMLAQMHSSVASAHIAVAIIVIFSLIFIFRLMSLGYIKIFLNLHDTDKAQFNTLFSCGNIVLKDIVASIMFTAMVVLGLICFIVPGVYFCVKYGYYGYFIVDKNAGICESFSMSAKATQGKRGEIFAFYTLGFLLNGLVGTPLFLIGSLVIHPAVTFAHIYVYRKIAPKK